MLSYAFVKPEKKTGAALDQMLEDLDTAVKLQRHVERKVDNSRLYEIENRIRDVIIHEQSKPIPSKKDQLEKQKAQELEMADEDLDDIRDEIFADDNVEEPIAEEPVAEEPAAEVEAPVEKPKKVIPFEPFVKVLDEAIEKGYSKATMRKMANILVLAFGKFQEPAQRETLKNSIRKFIVQYKAAVERERAEEAEYVAADAATQQEAYGEWQNPDAE